MNYFLLAETDFFRLINEAGDCNMETAYTAFATQVIELCNGNLDANRTIIALAYIEIELQHHPVRNLSEEKREIKFLSRNGKEYNFPHLLDLKFPEGKYVLDGEIYSDTLTFQEIVSAVKKVRDDTYKLSFRCYDIANNASQEIRLDKIQGIVEEIKSPFISLTLLLLIDSPF